MATDIVLLHYNNYFNRQIKVAGNVLSDYTSEDIYYSSISVVNFNEADGVSTSLILGKGELPTPSKALDSYDYLLVVDHEQTQGEYPVLSRWFIIDRDRTRDGQYQFNLRRDVIADNYDSVKTATTFIEKGVISDTTNPLLYNSENITFNQIKQSETLLKDSTGCGWVVGYVAQDAFQTEKTITKDVVIQSAGDIQVAGLTNWDYYPVSNMAVSQETWTNTSITKKIKLNTKLHYPAYSYPSAGINWPEHKLKGVLTVIQSNSTISAEQDSSASSYDDWSGVVVNQQNGAPNPSFSTNSAGYLAASMPSDSTLWTNLEAVLLEQGASGNIVIKTDTVINNLIALNGKIIKDTSTNSFYRITVDTISAESQFGTIINQGSAATTTFLSRLNNDIVRTESGTGGATIARTVGDYTANDVKVGYSGTAYQLTLTQIIVNAEVKIDSTRNHVVDAPYDIFCIPYSDTKKVKIDATHTVLCNKELAVGMAQQITKESTTTAIYDTQLLPYCPCIEIINKNPNISADDATIDISGLSMDVIYNSGTPTDYLGAIIWCSSSMRTFDINTSINVSNNAVERKIESECDMYRLCSGNYQGIFEFNAAKAYGVTGFRVDCSFKPYNPYIHVVPKLGGLYGTGFADYNDNRGLICSGDFSLAQLTEAWANYELQNKNYDQIFARGITNMEVMNKYANIESGLSAVFGSVSGAAGGAAAGMITGGPAAAIGMGIAGGVTSLAGGIADHVIGIEKQKETIAYTKEIHELQLGNIRAIPTSISKNTALTPNTKIFPFIEKYSCTDIEKEVLQNKLTYNGMTIMSIGTIEPYVGTGYFKGQIIRFNNLLDDDHMANAIYEEINKGVYL